MREILFKAKRKDTDEWVEGCRLASDVILPKGIEFCVDEGFLDGLDGNRAYEVDPKTVCQYTGLNDSNDNKVFEGDIIRYAYRYDYDDYMEEIENGEESDLNDMCKVDRIIYGIKYDYPAFDLNNHDFECNALSELNNGDWHYEVIGNIFDNPELLEVTSK